MRAILNKIMGTSQEQRSVPFSSVIVVYQIDKDTWRGFVMPYDITFEAGSRSEVIRVLRNMRDSYVEGLKQYKNTEHLTHVPLSYEEDREKWESISVELTNKLLNNTDKVDTISYYAEAALPA